MYLGDVRNHFVRLPPIGAKPLPVGTLPLDEPDLLTWSLSGDQRHIVNTLRDDHSDV